MTPNRPTRRQFLAGTLPALSGCLGVEPPRGDRRSPPTVGTGVDARLGFAGDVMLARRVERTWQDRDPAGVWGPLVDRLRGLDGLFVNLECCLSTRGEPWPDKTYHFRADPEWAIPALDAAGTTWASLANNHVLDFGPTAMGDTRQSLSEAGIAHAGAGPDRATALSPSLVSAGPLDIAVVALTDRFPEHGAGEDEPGTAYLALDVGHTETRATVRRLVQRAQDYDPDLVVASLHWGPNWETRPNTDQRRFARWLVEQGVDLVHGHSAHVVQGIERYHGRPICYDTGTSSTTTASNPCATTGVSCSSSISWTGEPRGSDWFRSNSTTQCDRPTTRRLPGSRTRWNDAVSRSERTSVERRAGLSSHSDSCRRARIQVGPLTAPCR
jgi:poly-gamma-glutamate synthesis protein (capsule biosynthesis protein)